MIEIIAGIIVLILAIIGIAQLSRGRGGRGPVNVEEALKMASNWRTALKQALYNPEKLPTVLKYMRPTVSASKGALSALYQKTKITREKVDAAFERFNTPIQDAIDYLDDIPSLANTVGLAYEQFRRGRITQEQFRGYVAKEIKALEDSFKRHYALRHAGMA